MSLRKYQEKRNFKKTQEPRGRRSKASKAHPLAFVIQKHAASHLHFDLRLEINGVLASWAVPKGPPLSSSEKRLAMKVEDHPYDYKDFEGIIPKGNYGAGKVIIWDEGSYEPADNTIADPNDYFSKALTKGHLSFILHGKKLSGQFALIKIKRDPKNSWLWLRTQNCATKKIKVTEKSVRSGLTLDELTAHPPTLDLTAIPKTAMPDSITPMLSTNITQAFDRKGWFFEIKWDGYRAIAMLNRQRVKLYSRHHQDFSDHFPAIVTALAKLGLRAVLDGELVVVDEQGRSHFQLMQQYQTENLGQLIYFVFDILWFDGHDLRNCPLWQRKQLLMQILPESAAIKISEHIDNTGKQFFTAAKKMHLEGIMAKDAASPYLAGKRSKSWLKIKARPRQEAVICGYTAPRGSRKVLGALILGIYERGHLHYVGHVGTGFTESTLSMLKTRLSRLTQTRSPFAKVPKTNTAVTWVKPQLVCEVSFHEWTADGYFRQAAYLGLREDKLARSVHRETAISTRQLIAKKSKSKKSSHHE